jgi:His/Glu/Gln/Arg/opine family amino acid ABC transporter permease subunit
VTYYFNFNVILRNIHPLLTGLGLGLFLAVCSLSVGVLIGLTTAFGAISKRRWLKGLVLGYTTIFRNTPLLVLIYISYFGLPLIGITFNREMAFIVMLSLYAGAYMMEVFRAGLSAIPNGLIEAGQTIGLRRGQIRWTIQLPIMIRNVLPSLSNYLISLFKDTSLASAIAIPELTYAANKITTETFRVFEAWITVGLMYLATCYLLAYVLRRLERRFLIAS